MILADDENIKNNIKTYNEVSGITCFAIDESGKTVYSEGQNPGYCIRFRELTQDKCPCEASHLYAARQSLDIGEPYVYFCPGGLVHWTSAIFSGGLFKGALVGGPIHMNIPDSFLVDEIICANNFDIQSRGKLQAYLNAVPVVEPEKVRYLSDMIHIMCRDIMSEESRSISERKRFYKDQAEISESIQYIKSLEYPGHISEYYPMELENELVERVKRGDKNGSRTILNELLGRVLFSAGSNLEITKARVLELMFVLSRAAVEGGGNLEMIFGLKYKYLNEVYMLSTVEELCQWIVKVLERFTDCIFTVNKVNGSSIIKKSVSYINENYMDDISLDSTAEHVYLSTAYFSRLFKKEMGMNFIDYLNKVRIEESKKYLADLRMSLSQIAHMSGFTDQSYYNKVFKKIEGISPGQFRKMI